ncbi:MAG: hypothetical protein ABR572_11895, partial [Cryomorphaceae bacterium]
MGLSKRHEGMATKFVRGILTGAANVQPFLVKVQMEKNTLNRHPVVHVFQLISKNIFVRAAPLHFIDLAIKVMKRLFGGQCRKPRVLELQLLAQIPRHEMRQAIL